MKETLQILTKKLHNELNALFASSMSLDDNPSTKSVELGDNLIMALDVIPLYIFLPFACYMNQDWEAYDFLVGLFSRALLVLPLYSFFM
jgi:hypothetical protein